jgi:hypothetical protein
VCGKGLFLIALPIYIYISRIGGKEVKMKRSFISTEGQITEYVSFQFLGR